MNRTFDQTAAYFRHGTFLVDCAEELRRCIEAVQTTGKCAVLSIKLSIKPAARDSSMVTVSDEITAKLPKLPVAETVLFITPENNLSANNPIQESLDLKVVQTAERQIKTVA